MFAALTVILLHYALAKRREAVCSFVTFKEGNIYIKVSNQFLIVTLEDILFAVLFDLPTGFKLGYQDLEVQGNYCTTVMTIV